MPTVETPSKSWRTVLGTAGVVLTGLAGVLTALANPDIDFVAVKENLAVVFGGLAVYGIGVKLQRLFEKL